ncbi:MAG: coenzyme F420-0:L-glutamate ligase [Candidatus Bathyarchaeota archaeon]|nr:coenzyme F420-0:L-glutamate ligase [Candidatus Bathyarchaeota archaeon]
MKLGRATEAVETGYWMPGANYLEIIAGALEGRIDDEDIVTVSEKALSTAKGRIIDESQVKPGFLARLLARFWMRIIWGYFLSRVCRLKTENIRRLRSYPLQEGAIHKQVVLRHATFLQALLWGSEGGIDTSNLPYSYVSLPLNDPQETAEEIRRYLRDRLDNRVTVMIVDTDKTYSSGGFHFTHRPKPLRGVHSFFGVVAYVAGRALRLKRRSTPLAVAGSRMIVGLALDLAEAAHKRRGSGAGPTVWDMAETFGVSITGVTWSMLRSLRHKPIVIIKRDKIFQHYSI